MHFVHVFCIGIFKLQALVCLSLMVYRAAAFTEIIRPAESGKTDFSSTDLSANPGITGTGELHSLGILGNYGHGPFHVDKRLCDVDPWFPYSGVRLFKGTHHSTEKHNSQDPAPRNNQKNSAAIFAECRFGKVWSLKYAQTFAEDILVSGVGGELESSNNSLLLLAASLSEASRSHQICPDRYVDGRRSTGVVGIRGRSNDAPCFKVMPINQAHISSNNEGWVNTVKDDMVKYLKAVGWFKSVDAIVMNVVTQARLPLIRHQVHRWIPVYIENHIELLEPVYSSPGIMSRHYPKDKMAIL